MAADQQPCAARVRDAVQGIQQAQLALPVQPLGQFVHGHELWLGDERTRQQGPLGLAGGHGAHGPVQDQPETHLQPQGAGLLTLGLGGRMVEEGGVAQPGADDFPDGYAQVVALVPVGHGRGDQAHMGPDADGRCGFFAEETVDARTAAALRRPQLAHQQAQERGLAGPVVADHRKMLPPRQGQGQAVQDAGGAQVQVDVVEMYFKTVHASSWCEGARRPARLDSSSAAAVPCR